MQDSTEKLLLTDLLLLTEPLRRAAASREHFDKLMLELGWYKDPTNETPDPNAKLIESLSDTFTDLQKSIEGIEDILEDFPDSADELMSALNTGKSVYDSIDDVVSLVELVSEPKAAPDPEEMADDLLSYLLSTWLRRYHPTAYQLLALLSVLEPGEDRSPEPMVKDATGKIVRLRRRKSVFRPIRLLKLLQDPVTTLTDYYLRAETPGGQALAMNSVADAQLLADRTLARIGRLLSTLNVPSVYGLSRSQEYQFSDDTKREQARRTLTVLLPIPGKPVLPRIGFTIEPSSASRTWPALGILSAADLTIDEAFGDWHTTLELKGTAPTFLLGPAGQFQVEGEDASLTAKLQAELVGAADAPALRFGPVDRTHFEVGSMSFTGMVSLAGEQKKNDYGLGFAVQGAALVITSAEPDSFLTSVLPSDDLHIDLDLDLAWSRLGGFSLNGGVGFEVDVPINRSIAGVLNVYSLHIGLKAQVDNLHPELHFELGVSFSLELGPVSASVERIGATVDVKEPPAGKKGLLGPVDLALDFLPPTGLGLVIDAPGLTGGGFIHFEPDEGRYWGALELNFADLAQISAFVMIETKIPGIDFSFLAMLFADELNIPLGMGFVLQGVGGMFAMNRGVDQKALEDIFWAGRANTLLFPGKAGVENAATLFTDLRAIFPARDGQFVFGPAVKIDWGSPTVVSLSLGIFVELPDPVSVTLVGTLKAGFPVLDPDFMLIKINVDLLGRFDPEGEFFYLYGHLRDSNILGIELTGDMALVINWGPHPYFAFSVGGFHPSYSAPADFPKLKRIAASVHEGPFNLEQQTYLALTSNSLQFGESVEASFEVAGFGLKGGYSYDCLFQWDPLYLEANFAAHLDILAGGETIFSCRISANLSGPSPWRLWGEAYIDLWLFEVSLPFDEKFGGQRERTKLDAPILKDIFTTELSDLTHWQGSLRGQRSPVRTQLHGQKGLVDPLCTLSFSQDKMPLGEVLEQYGSRPLPTPVTMAITGVSYNETSLAPLTPVMGPFARGQFKQLTNAQRLSLPDFESFEAGKAVNAQALMASGNGLDYNLTFETHVVKDQNNAGQKLDGRNVKGTQLRQQRALSSAHRAQFPHTRGRKTPDLSGCLEGIFSR